MGGKEEPVVKPVDERLTDEDVERLMDRADASGAALLGEGAATSAGTAVAVAVPAFLDRGRVGHDQLFEQSVQGFAGHAGRRRAGERMATWLHQVLVRVGLGDEGAQVLGSGEVVGHGRRDGDLVFARKLPSGLEGLPDGDRID